MTTHHRPQTQSVASVNPIACGCPAKQRRNGWGPLSLLGSLMKAWPCLSVVLRLNSNKFKHNSALILLPALVSVTVNLLDLLAD